MELKMTVRCRPAAEEILQLWAEYSLTVTPTHIVEVGLSNTYFNENATYTHYNYWEWYLIPKEVLFKPTSKVSLQQNRLKPNKIKSKPFLFNSLKIIPLRI
jgi:hypothetical protein